MRVSSLCTAAAMPSPSSTPPVHRPKSASRSELQRTTSEMYSMPTGFSHAASGAVAGFLATTLLHPLDLVKTRFHVQEHGSRRLPTYAGLFDAFRTIVRIEGWRGLYAGLMPNVVGNTTSWGVYMYAYNRCKQFLGERGFEGSLLFVSAATVAGTATTLIIHPVFIIKTRLQLQLNVSAAQAASAGKTAAAGAASVAAGENYAGSLAAFRRMIREEGPLSLYRGIGPALLLVSHASIQFLAYERCKEELLGRRKRIAKEAAAACDPAASAARGKLAMPQLTYQLSANDLVVASTLSKVCAILGTYPYQVVRSCMQQRAVVGGEALLHDPTMGGTIRHVWKVDGAFGFYRGVWAHVLRSTPQATMTLLFYEYGQRLLAWGGRYRVRAESS
jgi:solute carrier family 25 folate transporter 32